MKVIRATVILSFVVTFFASVDSTSACTCMDPMPLQAELEASSVVFAGEVIARRDIDVTEGGFPSAYGFTFRVSRAWKGVRSDTVEVGTSSMGTACGFHFLVGAEYLVYAGGGGIASATSFGGGAVKPTVAPPRLWTSSCSGTNSLFRAEGEIAALGEPTWRNRSYRVSLLSDELADACQKGDTTRVRELIRAGHDVNGRDRQRGRSALIDAAFNGHAETVRVLLEAGAEVNAVRAGTTALVEAARRGHLQTVKVLLEAGADPIESLAEVQPLMAAVGANQPELVVALLRAGAHADGYAFRAAAGKGAIEIIDAFLQPDVVAPKQQVLDMALVQASYRGHLDVVKRLLAAGGDPNYLASYLGTTLEAAARQGHIEIVKLLLESGAQIRNETFTAASRNVEILNLLEEARSKDSPASINVTPEMIVQASYAKDTTALEHLLQMKPDLHRTTESGDSALVFAGFNGRLDVIKLLVDAGADVDQTDGHGWTCLMRAAFTGHLDIVQFLIAKGADVNTGKHVNALYWAAQEGKLQVVDVLLANGAHVNTEISQQPASTALYAAVQRQRVDVVRRLLKAGADPALACPLSAAARAGDLELVNLLLEAGAPPNDSERPPLVAAASANRIAVVTRLLEAGADPKHAHGALHWAAVRGSSDIVRLLIERGMDVNAVDTHSGDTTPLHRAVLSGSLETVQVLVEAGADVNARAEAGITPLMIAIPYSEREVLVRKEQYRQIPDWKDPRVAMIALLLDAGADVYAKADNGRTPLDQAEAINDSAIVAVLREAVSRK